MILTSSNAVSDVNLAYQLGANSFLIKPIDFERLVEISQALKGYWLWMNAEPEVTRPQAAETKRQLEGRAGQPGLADKVAG